MPRARFRPLTDGGEIVAPTSGPRHPRAISAPAVSTPRRLDVKEIHGYNAAKGLELLKPDSLATHKSR